MFALSAGLHVSLSELLLPQVHADQLLHVALVCRSAVACGPDLQTIL